MDTFFSVGGRLMKSNRNSSKSNNYQSNQNTKLGISSGKLDVIASAIVTLGEALATVAAGLALEEEEKAKAQTQAGYEHNDLKQIKKQMDYLIREIEHINKKLK